MIYLVLIGSVVGYSAYVYALKYLPIATVSLYAYINPIIAVLLGTLMLDEPFTARIVAASALVLAGVAVVRASSGRPSGSANDPRPAATARSPERPSFGANGRLAFDSSETERAMTRKKSA
jgi:hypothetical protein